MKTYGSLTPQLFKLLKPLLHLSRVSGFLPITFEKKGSNYHLEESLKFKVYSYILATTLLVLGIWGLRLDSISQDSIRMQNAAVKYIIMVDLGEIIVTFFVGVVTTPLKMKYFWEILHGLGKIEKVLSLQSSGRFLWNVIVTMVLVVGVLGYDAVLWGLNSHEIGSLVCRFAGFYITYFLVFLQEIPFCFFVSLIRKNLVCLNGGLHAGLEEVEKNHGSTQWVSVTKKDTKAPLKSLSYDRLNDFMKLVEDTDDVIEAVNDFCGVHTFFILLSCLLHLVVTPYYLLMEVCNDGYFAFIFLQLAWVLVHMGRLMILVETCQNCINEYQRTGNLVLKLLTSPLSPEIKDQVEILTMQVSNKKIKFTSFGMMKISRAILTAFGGSVTTFLVILFQYGGARGNIYVPK